MLKQNEVLIQVSSELNLSRVPEEMELVRFAAQNSFICFCLAVMPKFMATKFHALLADKLQRAYETIKSGQDVRLIIEAPPQHGKSTLVSELFPAWVMGKEDWPVICASYGMSLAERKSQNARNIVDSDVYKFIFPQVRLNPDSTSKEYWQTSKKGSYKAVGRGGGLTGNPGKLLIADDLIADKEEANSQTVREGAWDWWNTVFYTRKQQHSGIILVETRWHLDDPAGKLEEQERMNVSTGGPPATFDHWEKITFPAIAEEDEIIDGMAFRKKGDALCPERFSVENLIKTKNAYSSAGKIGDWAALYQQQPIISENAEFHREWFKYFQPEDIRSLRGYYLTLVDLAISQKKSADNTVVRTIFFEYDRPNWYLMDETAGRLDPLQTIDAIFFHWNQYRSKVFIETVAYQAALQYFVVEEMRKRKQFFTIEELKVKSKTSKEERIRGLVPLYKAGLIFHRKGQDEGLEMEMLQFPKGVHDDRIDAVSMALGVAKHTPRNQDEQQIPGRIRKKVEVSKDFDPNKSITPV